MSTHDPRFFTFRQLMELDACTRCGECVAWCPTFAEKPELDAITPLRKIEAVRRFVYQQNGLWARLFRSRPPDRAALQDHSAGTYDCTLCGRCGTVCPVHIDTRHLWIAMRETMVRQGVYPGSLDHLREMVTAHYNISGDPNENRLIWAENLPEVPEGVGGKERAEVVYFVGCVASFYPRSYSVPQSLVEVMERAGTDYMTLGGEEWCCGFPLIIAGMGEAAVESVYHNVEAVRRTGATRLVATCPSCYHTWKHDYPRIIGEPLGFEVLHATELLEGIVGDLPLKPLEQTVTYHDPCDLGRTSGIYDAPRNVVRAIPGVTLVEMEHHHEYALCCGGGGDVEMADKTLTEAVAQRRIVQARETGAKVLLSACQQCERTLMGAARREKVRVRVMDVVELVARQMAAESAD
ncbi:MAG TPA: (Fe-S)-binding protein [Anaerolineae bacterium]|nr:(Fe-S)-binding protein [Anaerolineae bacterium]